MFTDNILIELLDTQMLALLNQNDDVIGIFKVEPECDDLKSRVESCIEQETDSRVRLMGEITIRADYSYTTFTAMVKLDGYPYKESFTLKPVWEY